MTDMDSQVASLLLLQGEIERIDRATREASATAASQPDRGLSTSFGMFSGLSPLSNVKQTVSDIVHTVHALLAKLAPVATLETSNDGLTARTVIQYTGRATSVWSNSLSSVLTAELVDAHMVSLQRAYALRAAFVGAVAAAGSALVSISVAVANPLTALHALASATALKQALERVMAAADAAR